ncbi:hypothetical protein [Lentibacillus sp.]|uniref:hypothetical protein n=1 Tax=Lentibacillus sp. TaxID=1925746 RepID=UPI002B4B8973|nr:hypothetical protein [Lentibacillus sp.]HLS09164.1 hypothetical protein [Lentibacillus sp.]
MLSQLISMVDSMRTEQTEMKEQLNGVVKKQAVMKENQAAMREEQTAMKTEQSPMRREISEMKTEGDRRHREIMDEFKILRADQDHIWKKTVENERDIAQLKHQISNEHLNAPT